MSKINLQKVTLTPADAAEALETIALMESDGRGLAAADLMYDDPHEPPYWWHNSRMVNLTLLARTVAAQEGTALCPRQFTAMDRPPRRHNVRSSALPGSKPS